MTWFFHLEESILLFFQSIRFEPMDRIMQFISYIGNGGMIWIAICLLLLCSKRFRSVGVIGLLSLLFCFVLNNLAIKNIVQRPRPFYTIEELSIIIPVPSEFSFPSGHSCSSFAAAHGIVLASRNKKFYVLYGLASLMAISRVYVGVHYLSDVLVGALVGIFGSLLVYTLYERFSQPNKFNLNY